MKPKYKMCPVCGQEFHVCYTCEKSSANAWKTVTDSFEHYSIYVAMVLYKRGSIDKEEAAQRISRYSLDGLTPSATKIVREIMS